MAKSLILTSSVVKRMLGLDPVTRRLPGLHEQVVVKEITRRCCGQSRRLVLSPEASKITASMIEGLGSEDQQAVLRALGASELKVMEGRKPRVLASNS